MDFLTDWLTGWLKDLLIDGIMGNLSGLFDNVNASVGDVAAQVGTTPAAWNAGVFSLIRQLSETVILPIAGMVLTFVATYELIQMLLEKNNMHEVDVANIYKWMFKTAIAILILSNTFNIVMAVFDVSQSVIASASGLVQGSTDISADMLTELEATLEGMGLGSLLGLFMQSILIQVCMLALNIVIFVIVYGRTRPWPLSGSSKTARPGAGSTAWAFGRGATRRCACWRPGGTPNVRRPTSTSSLFPPSVSTAGNRTRPGRRLWPSWGTCRVWNCSPGSQPPVGTCGATRWSPRRACGTHCPIPK